jgi:hypothetical protein
MMLLAIGSGLHHLPDGTVPDEVLKQVKSGIRNAYDFLVAGGQVRVVSLLVAAQLHPLKELDIDPLEIYTHATVARIGKAEDRHLIPIDCGGAVVEFPAPARAFIQAENIVRDAALGRKTGYLYAIKGIEALAYNGHRLTKARSSIFRPAQDFAHHGEIFLAQAKIVDGEWRWEPGSAPQPAGRIFTEAEFIRQMVDANELLGRHGLGWWTVVPTEVRPWWTDAAPGARPKRRPSASIKADPAPDGE